MIIQSSNVGMSSSRTYNRTSSRSLTMSIKSATITAGIVDNTSQQTSQQTLQQTSQEASKQSSQEASKQSTAEETSRKKENFRDFVNNSMEDETTEEIANSLTTKYVGRGNRSAAVSRIASADYRDALDSIRKKCISYLMALFYGMDDPRYQELQESSQQSSQSDSVGLTGESTLNASSSGLYQVQTFEIKAEETFEETETTSFATKGTVVNADGTTIEFNLSVEMSRSFRQSVKSVVSQTDIRMIDPLVINLDTNIAGLSDQKFEFDIDADGVLDTISALNQGSGYLALDLNEDGTINDGSELFGTKSQDGFSDLAQYDEDGNGWIDENDSIFHKLLIWCKNDSGEDSLYHLTEKGVGAICLNNAKTDFSLNSMKTNVTNGAVRRTGIFLYESGTVGTMQHIDVAN